MSFIESIFEKVRRHPKRVVFPEGADDRVLRAAAEFHDAGLGAPILLGPRAAIQKRATSLKLKLDRVGVIDPARADDLERFADTFVSLRRDKGMARDEALKAMKQPIYFATMMLHEGSADGLVAGASAAAASILRPLFQVIQLEPGVKAASSCSVIQLSNPRFGEKGVLFLADCSVIPDPTANELADIALMAAKLARQLHGAKPRVAFLSFSTKGSARHRTLDKILAAVALARQRANEKQIEAEFDGELQADAALLATVAEAKAAHSSVAGRANVLVFPDLNAGNIAYKLTQYLAGARAIGPILQGFSRPISDLSRGASVEDIVATAAVVLAQV